jgi:hypothetical protein
MAEIAAGLSHAASLVRRVGHLVAVNMGVEQEKGLIEGLAVRALHGLQEAIPELGVVRIETEGIGRLGQFRKEAHQTDETLALFGSIPVLPEKAPESMGHARSGLL